MTQQPLDVIPLWGVFALTIGFVFLLVEVGFLLGAARRRRSEDVKDASVGQMVGATLGLLAFMLAFTFGMAATRYDNRRALVMQEANAIQDAYLRAELLPQQQRAEIRSLLRRYVETRISWSGAEQVHEAIAESEAVQQRLWSHAVALGQEHPNSVMIGLFVFSVNELIDLHTKRVKAGLKSRIPFVIFSMLFFVTSLANASVGYLAGIAGKRANLVSVALVLAYASVFYLIIDLDRPHGGLLIASQQPLHDLRQRISVSPP
jgi:hypothetical protein